MEERIVLRVPHYGAFMIAKKFCTKENVSQLFQVSQPVLFDPETEEVTIGTEGVYDVRPKVIYTIADEKELEEEEEEEEDDEEEEGPVPPPNPAVRFRRMVAMEKARRELIQRLYKRKHEDIFHLKEELFVPHFLEMIRGIKEGHIEKEKLNAFFKKEAETLIFSFEIFTLDFCSKLVEEVEHFESFGLPIIRPNSMNNYGLILDEIGFESFFSSLLRDYLLPITSLLFSPEKYASDSLDSHHAFVVQYKMTEDRDLGFHYDDSDITLNLCLGRDFKGGDLYFSGHFDDPSTHKEKVLYQHKVGRAVLHIGRHRHGATPIQAGERYNLIVWFSSSSRRAQSCSNCCGHHHDHSHDNAHDDGHAHEHTHDDGHVHKHK